MGVGVDAIHRDDGERLLVAVRLQKNVVYESMKINTILILKRQM